MPIPAFLIALGKAALMAGAAEMGRQGVQAAFEQEGGKGEATVSSMPGGRSAAGGGGQGELLKRLLASRMGQQGQGSRFATQSPLIQQALLERGGMGGLVRGIMPGDQRMEALRRGTNVIGPDPLRVPDYARTPDFNPNAPIRSRRTDAAYKMPEPEVIEPGQGALQGPTLSGETLDVVRAREAAAAPKERGNILSRIWGSPITQGAIDFLGTTSQGGNIFQATRAVEAGRDRRSFNRYLDEQLKRTDISEAQRERYMAARRGGQQLTLGTGVMTPTQSATAGTRQADSDWYEGLSDEERRRAHSVVDPVASQRAANAMKMIPGETMDQYRARLARLYGQADKAPGREAPAKEVAPEGPSWSERVQELWDAWGFGDPPEVSDARRRLEEKYPRMR